MKRIRLLGAAILGCGFAVLAYAADGGEVRAPYRSASFPPGSVSMAHDLRPELQKKIRECVLQYHYSPEMIKAFQGADFSPHTLTVSPRAGRGNRAQDERSEA